MSKGEWKRDPVTKVPVNQIPEEYLTLKGEFDTRSYPGCDVFTDPAFAGAAGYDANDPRYFLRKVLTLPGSHFHAFQWKDEKGNTHYITCQVSAAAGGERVRSITLARQTGWNTDVKAMHVKWE